MVKTGRILVVCSIVLGGFIGVRVSKSQSVPPNQALKDLAIVEGAHCNEPGPPGVVTYLKNSNKSRAIAAQVKVTDSPSQGEPSTNVVAYIRHDD
jgi:hypothetical protein